MFALLSPAQQQSRLVGTQAFSFDAVAVLARDRAKSDFVQSSPLPAPLAALDYDSYRLIAYDHAAAIWKGTAAPFHLELFHRGYLFKQKVAVNLVEDGRVTPLAIRDKMFQYRGKVASLRVPADLGFAGFRVLGKFDRSVNFLEIASFLGASYFRAIGAGQVYGTSARGIAVDAGLPKAEEFPVFREFWIERPLPGASELHFWALLDSKSVAGAYEFKLRPGNDTVVRVKARLFFRRIPEKSGLAPMTSMWMWGDGRAPPAKDSRPKVHDSDGLLVHTGRDEWIWRPLSRQTFPSLTHYDFAAVRGFGLMQRERRPAAFRDNEAKYHLRPSVWIEPDGGWQGGAVELLELPAGHEGIDNIAAWWKPKAAPDLRTPLELKYTVAFRAGEPERMPARAVATRLVRRAGQPLRVEIDFLGDQLSRLPVDAAIECRVAAQRGETANSQCIRNTDGRWSLGFDVRPKGKEPVELEAALTRDGQPLTESWRYLCSGH